MDPFEQQNQEQTPTADSVNPQPANAQPANPQPDNQPPVYQHSTYQPPVNPPPAYQQAAYPPPVYQQPGYPQNNQTGGSAPSGDRPPKSKAARVLGLTALILSVAVLFSALAGGLVYMMMKNRLPGESTSPTTAVTDTTKPGETTQVTGPSQTQAPTGNLNDKNFSLEKAASRKDANKKTLSVMEIAAEGKPAVVAINTTGTMTDLFGQTGNFEAAGSGFIITKDGYIVTNNHVIDGAMTITVVLDNGDIYNAKLVGRDARNDLAVIKIQGSNLPTVYLGDSSDLQVGELAVAIGNPLGELSGTVTAGIISALDRLITLDGQSLHLLQTDAAINAGNSGGALFNSFGEVIGINTAKTSSTGVEGLGFAIPINVAKPIIESLIQNGYVTGRPKIGITPRDITKQMADYYHLTEGIYIYDIESGSAADQAGLKREDIIIAVNGKKITTTAELTALKDTMKPGDTMVMTIVRDGNEMTVTVVLKEEVPSEATPASTGRASESYI
jgi:serine protease Do